MGRQVKVTEYTKPQNHRELLKIQKEEANKSFWHKFIVFSFFVIIFGMLAMRLALPAPTVSMSENRELKKMPSTSLNNIFFGTFTTEFENYFADTFPLRDPLMNAGEYVSYLYKIPVKGIDSIVVADDNVMQDEDFENEEEELLPEPSDTPSPTEKAEPNPLTGETHVTTPTPQPQEVLKEQKGTYLLTDTAIYKELVLDSETYGSWAQGINRLVRVLPDKRVMALSVPNSFPFYADPKYFKPENDERAGIANLYTQLDEAVVSIDTIPLLEQHKGEYIYFRTDVHWTARGAYCGYLAFCEKTGMTPLPLDEFRAEVISHDFLGTYYFQVKNSAKAKIIMQSPDHVEYFVPPAECTVMIYDNASFKNGREGPMFDTNVEDKSTDYHLFFSADYPCIKITTDTDNGRSIMLLKDSYADAFAPYLVSHYQTIYIIDFRCYNAKGKPKFKAAEFVKKNNVDDVLCLLSIDLVNNPTYVKWYLKALP